MAVLDVGDEGVGGVEGLSMGLAGALRGGEEVSRSLGALGGELAEEALLRVSPRQMPL